MKIKFNRAKVVLNAAAFKDQLIKAGLTPEQADATVAKTLADEVYLSECGRYQVAVDRKPPHGMGPGVEVIHLSIKRVDRQPLHDWRILQAIKNGLLGEEVEAVELYPAESRLVDSANQYHLWAFPGLRVPLGWTDRNVTEQSFNGSVQRPFEEMT